MNRSILLVTVLGACVALLGCNTVPVVNLEKTFSIRVEQESGTAEKVKIDFLWMVDNSTSMCEEQVALAQNFQVFVDTLDQLDIDPRIAVTTADMQCDPNEEGITTSKGIFNTEYEDSFPPSCFAKKLIPCISDSDCETATGEPGKWWCKKAQSLTCMITPNGSVNSSCIRKCEDDGECQQYYGDMNYVCQSPPGLAAGCVLPPQTTGGRCPPPNEMPQVLTAETVDLFPCLATVGVNQQNCFKYEQGLQAALSAIDPNGINPEQAKGFLREDAYLVIIFVTDEDDCSVPPENPGGVAEDYYDTCAVLLEDSNNGGPLVPVSHYINRFKSLKKDPSRVIVAAIAGEGLAEPPPHVDNPAIKECRDLAKDACEFELPDACLNMAPACVTPPDDPACAAVPAANQLVCNQIECVKDDPDADDCLDDAVDLCEDQHGLECAELKAREFFCEDPNPATCDPDAVVDPALLLDWERHMFVLSKGDSRTCYHQSYVCLSEVGTADWGRRYKELTDGFGDFGLFRNICSAHGIGPALEEIADLIVSVVNKICLPQPIKEGTNLDVYKQYANGTGEPLVEGPFEDGGDYRIISADECEFGALTFADPPQLNEQIILGFEGDPVFEL